MERKYLMIVQFPDGYDERAIDDWEEALFDEEEGISVWLTEEMDTPVKVLPYEGE